MKFPMRPHGAPSLVRRNPAKHIHPALLSHQTFLDGKTHFLYSSSINSESNPRLTFLDWAKEILEMKKRLGMEHVGLGTDGGGHLSRFVDGFKDVGDLVHLVKAMQELSFTQDEIAAYMGRNFYRVLQSYLG